MKNENNKTDLYRKAIQRKAYSLFMYAVFTINSKLLNRGCYAKLPPIIVNSLPKSGTHLLLPIVETLPYHKNLSRIIATRTSYSKSVRTPQNIHRRLSRILPGEIVGAHLPFSNSTAHSIDSTNALHLFVYRHPCAVIISEINYVVEMAPWNILHKRFASLKSEAARINLAIFGDGTPELPPVRERYQPYYEWVKEPSVVAFNFDDLVSTETVNDEIRKLVKAYARFTDCIEVLDNIESVAANFRLKSSHTFTGKDPSRWKRVMSEEQILEITSKFGL